MNNITIRGITLTLEEEHEVFMHYQLKCVYHFVDDRLNECEIVLDEDMLTDWVKKIVARKDEIMDDDIHLDVWDAYEMAFDEFDIKRIYNFTDEIIAIDVSSDIVF